MSLRFGYNRGLPAGRTVAWGARLIVTQDGSVDFVHNRQDAVGAAEPRARLVAHVNGLGPAIRDRISDLLRTGAMSVREAADCTLHADDAIVVRANTNGSCGYCYVVVYFADPNAEREQP